MEGFQCTGCTCIMLAIDTISACKWQWQHVGGFWPGGRALTVRMKGMPTLTVRLPHLTPFAYHHTTSATAMWETRDQLCYNKETGLAGLTGASGWGPTHRIQRCEIPFAQVGQLQHMQVVCHVCRVGRARQYCLPRLQRPAQHNLHRRPPPARRDALHDTVAQHRVDRLPRHHLLRACMANVHPQQYNQYSQVIPSEL